MKGKGLGLASTTKRTTLERRVTMKIGEVIPWSTTMTNLERDAEFRLK